MNPLGNARVRPVAVEVLSDDWYVLRKATFDFQGRDGGWTRQSREAYDRGNGATILLYEPRAGTVLLTRQFRWPAYANGHPDGMLIETPAGLLDQEDPEAAIRREAEEETGVRVGAVEKLFEVFMSPGSVTERVHFFAAPYEREHRDEAARGVAEEGEDIEVLEVSLSEALAMVRDGRIADAKTIMLLQWAERHGVVG
ncbi:NUDIX domain-containing protein [Solirubrobacter taibaiensis]|nr:NUDIX domain-containing protein [Solirubrobacter taibaiensis]